MSATARDLADSLFEDPTFEEKSLRFATDAGCQVVYITRERHFDLDENGEAVSNVTKAPLIFQIYLRRRSRTGSIFLLPLNIRQIPFPPWL